METEVLIVGAGPTGLALSVQLSRFGVDHVIIDKKEGTTPFSRAIGVQARTLEIYDQLGIAQELVSLGHPAEKARMIVGGEVRGEANLKNIGTGMSRFPFMLVVEQGLHEKVLYDHLKTYGRDVNWLTGMSSFAQTDSGVEAKVENGETISAKFLVGCDGSKSFVRHGLGLTFEGDTVDRLFYVADVAIDWDYGHDALCVCLAEHSVTAFFPMAGDRRFRIVGTFPEGHEQDENAILFDEIERQIVNDTELTLDITEVNWFSVYRVHSRVVDSFSAGRCFVAGDAAHIHTPAGGQGMNTGIQDGYNLAWKLAAVLKHGYSKNLLDTYNEERLPNAHRLLATTDRMFEFGVSENWLISFIRQHIFPHIVGAALSFDVVKRSFFPLISQIAINYEHSSLSKSIGNFAVAAGDRMPWFEIDGKDIYDLLHEPRFHVLGFGMEELPALDTEFARMLKLPISESVVKYFGSDEPFFVVLRPDNYIGLLADGNDPSAVRSYFEQMRRK